MKPQHILRPLLGRTAAVTAMPALVGFKLPPLTTRIRADASDPKVVLDALAKSFEEFKAENDKKLAAKAGRDDVVSTEKVDKLAAQVLDLQAALDKAATEAAAARLAGGGKVDAFADPDYSKKFAAYFRDGTGESDLKAMQRTGPRAALTEGVPANGGFTTPIEWDRTIGEKIKLVSPMRGEATIQPISTVGFSKVFTDRSVGSGWVGETAARPTTTTPGFTTLTFTPGEIYANPAASQDLLDDSLIDVEKWLAAEVEVEFARQEGIAFISGDGVAKPIGILTYVTGAANAGLHPFGAIVTTPSVTVGGYSSDPIVDLVWSLPKMWQANAKFYASRLSMAKLMKLKDGQGNYLWQRSFTALEPATLLGAPVVDMPDMPNVVTGAIPLLYGDMRETYLIVDRMGTRVLRDPYTNKPFVLFYTTKRVGGGVKNPDAMKAMVIS